MGDSRSTQRQIGHHRRQGPVAHPECQLPMAMALVLLGWVPLLYRRFSHDEFGRPLGRALLAGVVFWWLAQLAADLTFRYPHGWLYPLLLLVPPVGVNLFTAFRYVLRRAKRKPQSE